MLESGTDLYVCFTWRRQERLSEPSPNKRASARAFPCYTKHFDNAPLWCAAQNSTGKPVIVSALCFVGLDAMCCVQVRRKFRNEVSRERRRGFEGDGHEEGSDHRRRTALRFDMASARSGRRHGEYGANSTVGSRRGGRTTRHHFDVRRPCKHTRTFARSCLPATRSIAEKRRSGALARSIQGRQLKSAIALKPTA